MNALRHKHQGETCWIVGKGPSLRDLSARSFGDGPVIALNDAIMVVQELALPNPIYSLQKDGYPEHMVEPHADVTLILQSTPGYSGEWFQEHPTRILVDPLEDLGFDHVQALSTRMAIEIAKQMGCDYLKVLCCDNLVMKGTLATYEPRDGTAAVTGAAKWYKLTRPYILEDLISIPHEFIIPAGGGA